MTVLEKEVNIQTYPCFKEETFFFSKLEPIKTNIDLLQTIRNQPLGNIHLKGESYSQLPRDAYPISPVSVRRQATDSSRSKRCHQQWCVCSRAAHTSVTHRADIAFRYCVSFRSYLIPGSNSLFSFLLLSFPLIGRTLVRFAKVFASRSHSVCLSVSHSVCLSVLSLKLMFERAHYGEGLQPETERFFQDCTLFERDL